MQIPILQKHNVSDLKDFIDFWSRLYSYPSEKKYYNNISKKQFNEIELEELFEWKNGMILSGKKKTSFNKKIKSKLPLINVLKSKNDFLLDDFLDDFKNVSSVWKIFLLHIIYPNKYPIYDQHIHRSYNFIHDLDYERITHKLRNEEKEKFYFEIYLKFFHEIKGCDLKKADEAFFSFGQFLNTKENAKLLA